MDRGPREGQGCDPARALVVNRMTLSPGDGGRECYLLLVGRGQGHRYTRYKAHGGPRNKELLDIKRPGS